MESFIQFKNKDMINHLNMISPLLLQIMAYVALICNDRKIPFEVTSIIRPKNSVTQDTGIHESGRAFDMSVAGLTQSDINYIIEQVTIDYNHVGAISRKTGKRVVAWYENKKINPNATGSHIHFQVHNIELTKLSSVKTRIFNKEN